MMQHEKETHKEITFATKREMKKKIQEKLCFCTFAFVELNKTTKQ